MREVFGEIDVDGSNSIDKHEFQQAMKIFKIKMTDREVSVMYERYDVDRSGSIDYNEFLELFGFKREVKENEISEELRKETDALIRKLKRDLEREMGKLNALFPYIEIFFVVVEICVVNSIVVWYICDDVSLIAIDWCLNPIYCRYIKLSDVKRLHLHSERHGSK